MFADLSGRITRFSSAEADLAKAQRFAGRAILPGMVNGHSHAFQRVLRGRTEHRTSAEQDSFWTWRESMYFAANRLSPEGLYHASRMAFLEMLLGGITTVGEFHYVHGAASASFENRSQMALQVIRAAREVGLRIAFLRTAYARSGWRKPQHAGQAPFLTPLAEDFVADTEALLAAIAQSQDDDAVWVGVAPHSLRAVPLDYVREVVMGAGTGRRLYAGPGDQRRHFQMSETHSSSAGPTEARCWPPRSWSRNTAIAAWSTASPSPSRRARSSACSAPMAPARPPPSTWSSASSSRTRAR